MKHRLREKLKSKRRELSDIQIKQKSDEINKKLSHILEDKFCVMAYLSAFKEVCVDEIITELINSKKTAAVPVTDENTLTITPCKINGLTALTKGAYGIREPLSMKALDKNEIEAVIVPGIGFDKKGGRIGFGKGYYDRFLADFNGLKIGVCYDFQLVDCVYSDEHDIPMDIIITESDCYVI